MQLTEEGTCEEMRGKDGMRRASQEDLLHFFGTLLCNLSPTQAIGMWCFASKGYNFESKSLASMLGLTNQKMKKHFRFNKSEYKETF